MGSRHEHNPSLWVATEPGPAAEPMPGDTAVDVAIVGAGITGLTLACLLADEGARIMVVDAGPVAAGTTGYTTAKVTALHGAVYHELLDAHGEEHARAYATANQAGLDRVTELVERHAIDCDLTRAPAYTYAVTDAGRRTVDAEVDAARRVGLTAEFVADTELPLPITGAVRLADQAHFHPRRYCRGLVEVLHQHDVPVHAHTRVASVDRSGVLTTDHGTIRAGCIVLATLLPPGMDGLFAARAFPSRSYALAASLRAAPPQGMYLGIDEPTRSVRPTADGRLIIGGEGHKTGQDPDTAARYAALQRWARAHFDVASVDFRWSAQDYRSADGLPYVGPVRRRHDRVLVATGFRKWGMTNGTAAAMMLADRIAGRANPWAATFDPCRARGTAGLRALVTENADVARRFVGERLHALGGPRVADIPPGSGAVTRAGTSLVGVFRDDDGTLAGVSPTCPHMGCQVTFNTAERTWDCPCHGSRFDTGGRVLDGPATRDLDPVEVTD